MDQKTISTLGAFVLLLLAPGIVGAHGDEVHSTSTQDHSEKLCPNGTPEWREAQTVAGVEIQKDESCTPDKPSVVAASVKGTNNIPKNVLMNSGFSPDTVVKRDDRDGDGDPDFIHIRLEIIGLNEGTNPQLGYEIAPGIKPAFWTFAPKSTGMASEGSNAASLMRMPGPAIRVEQGDTVKVTVENTHYMPHTIHFHGSDHSYLDSEGEGNDGVPLTSEKPILPGEQRTYDFSPRTTGTMFYHCHVQPDTHVLMGLQGMFIVEEDRPNNELQTFNPGGGKVRHPSQATQAQFDGEFDLQYQGVDAKLHNIPKETDDPRRIAERTNREYDVTDRDPDYYLLNGKSFPYTLRDSQIIVEPNKQYRLRMLNGGSETISIHTHGHKFEVRALDGVELPSHQRYHRDVIGITAAQRADVVLNTTNDGLNSYGEGVWLFHDHREEGVTNNGMSPGGNISMITYAQFLGYNGFPETQGVELARFFDPKFYEREIPLWEQYADPELLGEPFSENPWKVLGYSFLVLVASGLLGWGVHYLWRKKRGSLSVLLFAAAFGATAMTATPVHAQEMEGMQEENGEPMEMSEGDTMKDMEGMGEMNMGGMRMRRTENTMVMNENTDTPPPGCDGIAAEKEITVQAGTEFAKQFGGTMFTYDEHNFEVEPCTKLTVTFENKDDVRHQFMVHGLPQSLYPMSMFTIEITGKGEETGTFITPADPATMLIHCGVPQHEEKGMKAQLKNGEGDGNLANIPGLNRPIPGDTMNDPLVYGVAGLVGFFGGYGIMYRRRK